MSNSTHLSPSLPESMASRYNLMQIPADELPPLHNTTGFIVQVTGKISEALSAITGCHMNVMASQM